MSKTFSEDEEYQRIFKAFVVQNPKDLERGEGESLDEEWPSAEIEDITYLKLPEKQDRLAKLSARLLELKAFIHAKSPGTRNWMIEQDVLYAIILNSDTAGFRKRISQAEARENLSIKQRNGEKTRFRPPQAAFSSVNQNGASGEFDPSKETTCETCGVAPGGQKKLATHLGKEHGLDVWVCKICGGDVSSEDSMSVHLRYLRDHKDLRRQLSIAKLKYCSEVFEQPRANEFISDLIDLILADARSRKSDIFPSLDLKTLYPDPLSIAKELTNIYKQIFVSKPASERSTP